MCCDGGRRRVQRRGRGFCFVAREVERVGVEMALVSGDQGSRGQKPKAGERGEAPGGV